MTEDEIALILSDDKGSIPVSVRIPKILLDRISGSYRKKVGAVKARGITSQALIYFSARGVLDWESKFLPAMARKTATMIDGPDASKDRIGKAHRK